MRRRPDATKAPPRWVLDPRPEDFPNPACHWQCAYWQARAEYDEQHPDAEYPAHHPMGPDTPWHPELI